tara:strand:+ start:36 stop:1547 length:1512 start_codon:yes stop_codon:yes gene_type:complete
MARTKISEFSATPASNTDIDSIFIGEGMAPSNVNDAIRELMAQLKDFQTGAVGDSFNGPVGTTTAAAGAFTTLSATGNVTLGDASTDTLNVGNGGLIKDASGNVGIGVTPSAWGSGNYKGFQVGGSASIMGRAAGSDVYFMSNTYFDQTNYIYTTSRAAASYSQNAGAHQWFNAPSGTAGNAITFTQAMTLDASGNLGIGTSSPVAKLHVVSNNPIRINNAASTSQADLSFADSGATLKIDNFFGTGSVISFGTNPNGGSTAERARIDSSGQLGIGTTSPQAFLHVAQTSGLTPQIKLGATSSYQLQLGYNNSSEYGFLQAYAANLSTPDDIVINPSGGNLLVGTTSAGTDKVRFASAGNSSNQLGLVSNDDASNNGFVQFRNAAGTSIGSITRVTTTNAVAYNTTSDYRLKTVTGAVTGQGARIDALKPIDYQWTDGGQQARGFLAHEFQSVYLNSVIGTKDAVDADGNPVYQSMQAATSEVIADLVAEIQSLRKRLADAGI